MFIPSEILTVCLVLLIWWAHRRVERKEYAVLAISVLLVCVPLVWLAQYYHHIYVDGCFPASRTLQLPLSVAVTVLIVMLPARLTLLDRGLRIGLAFVMGWLLVVLPF